MVENGGRRRRQLTPEEKWQVFLEVCSQQLTQADAGREMLAALVAGTTDPAVLADLARGRLREKIPALREALVGRFEDEYGLIVGQILAHVEFLEEAIDRLSARSRSGSAFRGAA